MNQTETSGAPLGPGENAAKDMHLHSEQLLELLHGEAAAEDLAAYLEHIEICDTCSETFAVMVALRAHRHEALGALAVVSGQPSGVVPLPEPAPLPRRRWANTALRLAASVALAALLGVMLWSTPISDGSLALRAELAALATDEVQLGVRAGSEEPFQLVGNGNDSEFPIHNGAARSLRDGRFDDALETLEPALAEHPDDEILRLLAGIAYYHSGDVTNALTKLEPLADSNLSQVARTAQWYAANAMLKDGRAGEALEILGRLAQPVGLIRASDAADLRAEVERILASFEDR